MRELSAIICCLGLSERVTCHRRLDPQRRCTLHTQRVLIDDFMFRFFLPENRGGWTVPGPAEFGQKRTPWDDFWPFPTATQNPVNYS